VTTLPLPTLAEPPRRSNALSGGRRRQGGVALLAMLTLLTLFGLYLFVGQLSAMQFLEWRASRRLRRLWRRLAPH
jgi:hypothetical protein